jgi:hypothetical protein
MDAEKQDETTQPKGVSSQHAVYPVPHLLLQAIVDYLTSRPHREVDQFLRMLAQIQALDGREIGD